MGKRPARLTNSIRANTHVVPWSRNALSGPQNVASNAMTPHCSASSLQSSSASIWSARCSAQCRAASWPPWPSYTPTNAACLCLGSDRTTECASCSASDACQHRGRARPEQHMDLHRRPVPAHGRYGALHAVIAVLLLEPGADRVRQPHGRRGDFVALLMSSRAMAPGAAGSPWRGGAPQHGATGRAAKYVSYPTPSGGVFLEQGRRSRAAPAELGSGAVRPPRPVAERCQSFARSPLAVRAPRQCACVCVRVFDTSARDALPSIPDRQWYVQHCEGERWARLRRQAVAAERPVTHLGRA